MNTTDILASLDLLNILKPVTALMPEGVFIPFLCMLTEEYCLDRQLSVVEMIDQIQELVHQINVEQGVYGHEIHAG